MIKFVKICQISPEDLEIPNILGLDISWKSKGQSGMAVFHRKKEKLFELKELKCIKGYERLKGELESLGNAFIFVDAPLRKIKGFRELDLELLRFLRKFRIGLLPVKEIDTSEIVRFLENKGYRAYPELPVKCKKAIFETYPQAVSLGLFREKLSYKLRNLKVYERKRNLKLFLKNLCIYLKDSGIELKGIEKLLEFRRENIKCLMDRADAFVAAIPGLLLFSSKPIEFVFVGKSEEYMFFPWLLSK